MSTKAVAHPPNSGRASRAVSWPDRIALRVGMALIGWARRARRPPCDPDLLRRVREENAERRRAWERDAALIRRW